MSDALQVIQKLPGEFAARLMADDYFVNVPVIVAEEGNVLAELQKKQAAITAKGGNVGAAVIVLQIVADDLQPNIQFGPMTMYPSFQTIENLELNRGPNGTGKSSRQLARRVRDVIKTGIMIGLITDLRPDKPCIEPVDLSEELGRNVKSHRVNFRCIEKSSVIPSQVGLPQFVSLAPQNQFSITSATPGAQIYYTLDDTFPAPPALVPGSTAQLFGAPIQIPAQGLIVRACAFLPGMIASLVNRATITAAAINQG